MKNFLMKDGDLVIGEDKHLVLATEIETISQVAVNRVNTNLGEDYIDPQIGIEYINTSNAGAIGKSASEITIDQDILTTLENIDGVEKAEIIDTELDSNRVYRPSYRITLENGATVGG